MRPKLLWRSLAALILAAAPSALRAASEAELRAAMIYNIARFVEWPQPVRRSDDFAICAVGDNEVTAALRTLDGKQLHGRPITTQTLRRDSDIGLCQVVYVAPTQSVRLPLVLELLTAAGTAALTVGDAPSFLAMGGTVQLLTLDGKPRFRILRGRAEASGLQVRAKLLQLALPADS